MNRLMLTCALSSCVASSISASTTSSQSPQITQAIDFLKKACVTGGSSLDIRAAGDGSIILKRIGMSGARGSVRVERKNLEGLADATSAINAKQASEMRQCMKPYIDRILNVILAQK